MKTGKSLIELATEIERQSKAKVDYIADTRKLEMQTFVRNVNNPDAPVPAPVLVMHNGSTTTMGIRPLAHRQIGERVGIPAKYYEKMLAEAPDLLAMNVNRWFKQNPEKRLVRTLDGFARSFNSNKYQRIDNNHIAEVTLPVLVQTPGIEVVSTEITDAKLYIKAVTHSVRGEVKSLRRGDIVEAGIVISNSEVGLGSVSIQPFLNFLYCTNGMILPKAGLRANHVGTRLDGDEYLAEILQDDTRKALDRSVLLKVRDVVANAMTQVALDKAIAAMNDAATQQITGNPAQAIEVLADDFGFNGDEKTSILRHLIQGGDTSRYGLINAVTRTAEDVESYDRATEIEALGGRLLELSAASWTRIAVAA